MFWDVVLNMIYYMIAMLNNVSFFIITTIDRAEKKRELGVFYFILKF